MPKKTKNLAPPPDEVEQTTNDDINEDAAGHADREMEAYLQACTRIDPLDIQSEYIRISADLAYWNDRYAERLRTYLRAEVDLKILKAQLLPLTQQALLDAGGKTTVDQVKAAVECDERVIDAAHALVDAEVEKNRAFGTLDAIRSKKEMLISLGAQLRAEMGGDPLLRQQVATTSRRQRGIDE